jgi:hypothetical protein
MGASAVFDQAAHGPGEGVGVLAETRARDDRRHRRRADDVLNAFLARSMEASG